MSYAEDVGRRLRQARLQRGLSLQDLERQSDGVWKAPVVGSYERGDRNISASKLVELAEYYGVEPSELIPDSPNIGWIDRDGGLALDLKRLRDSDGRWHGLIRYCESIQMQRGDYTRDVLSIRGDDLRALAIVMDKEPDHLLDELRSQGILVSAASQ